MGGIWEKVFVTLYLFTPLVDIPATLLGEVEEHAIVTDWGWDIPRSGVNG